MKKQFLEAGKISGTYGVRGMLRVQSWCDSNEVFCNFKKLYLDKNGENMLCVSSSSPHGNVVIMKIKGIDTIEEAEALRNKIVYVNREQLNLDEGTYLIQDLIDCKVFHADNKEPLGVITDVSKTGSNDVWHIEKDGKEFLIPVIDDVVIKVAVDEESVFIRPLKGIFDDED